MPAQRLQRRLDNSADLSDLIRLAASFNGGVDYLCAQIRKRAENVQLPH
jgi:lipopolysaccharide biosynthesis regulator YciM